MAPINRTAAARARALGYRSGLETRNAQRLDAAGEEYSYEPFKLPFMQPEKPRTYTPDFVLPNGIIIDTKGRWTSEDRQKFKMIKEQHPDLDIRMVFSNPLQKIGKKSQTTYAMVAQKYGLPWAKEFIPQEWLDESPNEASLAAIAKLKK